MKILSNKKYSELILKSCKGMFGAVTDDMLLRENALLNEENKQLKEKIDKAIEYMQDYCELVVPDANIKSLILKEEYKKIIEILGEKE